MIKAMSNRCILIGLSSQNIKQLQAGSAIKFNTKEEFGIEDYDILIFSEETEAKMLDTIKKACNVPSIRSHTTIKPKK